MTADLSAAIDRLTAGGEGALRDLINEGVFGRGGMSGHHVVHGLESIGTGETLGEAIQSWVSDAGDQIAAKKRGPSLPLWQEGQVK